MSQLLPACTDLGRMLTHTGACTTTQQVSRADHFIHYMIQGWLIITSFFVEYSYSQAFFTCILLRRVLTFAFVGIETVNMN